MDLEGISEVKNEKNDKKMSLTEKFLNLSVIKRNVIPIIILYVGIFCLVAGYVIHEQVNGYYCTVAFSDWSSKHVFKIPLNNFSNEMDRLNSEIHKIDISVDKYVNLPNQ